MTEKLYEYYGLDFTEEEKKEIEQSFNRFMSLSKTGKIYVKSEYKDNFQKNWAARALLDYAQRLHMESVMRDELSAELRKDYMVRAITAIDKAYRLTRLPIYLYDIAFLLSELGKTEEAKPLFLEFLRCQATLKPTPYEKIILSERNIAAAKKDTKKRLKISWWRQLFGQ